MARSRSSVHSTSHGKKTTRRRAEAPRIGRPDPTREPKKTLLISTEDEVSSLNYLKKFVGEEAVRERWAVSFADHAGSNPRTVAHLAKKTNNEEGPFDETWLVFDTEGPQNHQRIADARDAVETARQLGYRTAVSNPCFEFWLILHFERFAGTIADDSAACHRLWRHIKEYEKGFDCYTPTRPLLDRALQNARELFAERCTQNAGHPCDCHPCTQLFRLINSLLG